MITFFVMLILLWIFTVIFALYYIDKSILHTYTERKKKRIFTLVFVSKMYYLCKLISVCNVKYSYLHTL